MDSTCEKISVRELPEPPDTGDDELVARTRRGDRQAFSELVQRYHERILHTIFPLVKNRDDADDLAQEIFLKAYCALPSFRGRSQFYTWLHRLGINHCLDWKKSRDRRRDIWTKRMDWERGELPDRASCRLEASDMQVLRRELQDILDGALGGLPAEYRTTVVLREINGLSYKEIAYALGCPVGTVKCRLFRAKTQLREALGDTYREWYRA